MMSKINTLIHSFNSGEMSKAGLARIDKERVRLCAEIQENIFPYVVGKAIMRPGLQYLGNIREDATLKTPPRILPFNKSSSAQAILELGYDDSNVGRLRVWVNDELVTRDDVDSTILNGTFDALTNWDQTSSGDATATVADNQLTLECPSRGGRISINQPVATASSGTEHALRIDVERGPVIFKCGSSLGEDDYIAETELDTGLHSIAFTPFGTITEEGEIGGIDSYVKLMLHCDGTDGSTTFTDSSDTGHTVTVVGNAQIDTNRSKFGTASGFFDGTGDYLTLDGSSEFAFGSNDFTIDLWFYHTTSSEDTYLYDARPSGTNGAYVTIILRVDRTIDLYVGSLNRITSSSTYSMNTWTHLALVRYSGTTTLYKNGVNNGTWADSTTYLNPASRPVIAARGYSLGGSPFTGWIDEIRISNGIARWTTDFTPPTSAYQGDVFGGSYDGYYVQFESEKNRKIVVNSIAVESAGVMEIEAPWEASDLRSIRHDQSGDIVFLSCNSWKQKKIERRGNNSWSLVDYETDDGPHTITRTSNTRLKPTATHGNTTLTSETPFFKSTHVGVLFRLTHEEFDATFDIGGEYTFTDAIRIYGTKSEEVNFNVVISGTWSGTIAVQRSYDSGDTNFTTVSTYTTNGTHAITGILDVPHWIRVGFEADGYTSGSATIQMTYTGYSGSGVCRVIEYGSPTSVSIEVLSDFKNTTYTNQWQEGEWSSTRGYPTAVTFFDGRLWWSRRDKFWGSESDNYYAFNLDTEGDAGSIQRSIATGGAMSDARYMLPLQRLIFGTTTSEVSARASNFDEPLTPTNLTLKDASNQGGADIDPIKVDTRGVFVQRGRNRVYELAYDIETNDYTANDLTRYNEDIGHALKGVRVSGLVDNDIVDVSFQRQPATYIWIVRDDGICPILIYDPHQEVLGWFKMLTGQSYTSGELSYLPQDKICSVAVLPSQIEDTVYCVVGRRIDDDTNPYTYTVEKLTKFKDNVYRVYNTTTQEVDTYNGLYQCDSFITATVASDGYTVSGVDHLIGSTVIAIGPHRDSDGDVTHYGRIGDTYTVDENGEITLSQSTSGTVTVGLPYTGKYKSAKLAYGAQMGSAVGQMKRVAQLGLLLSDYNQDGILVGSDFDDEEAMDELPQVEDGAPVDNQSTLIEEFDGAMFPFPGEWNTDSRVCIQIDPGYSATLNGLVVGVDTSEK